MPFFAPLGGTISIHALLAESDPPPISKVIDNNHFYPRSPCGERQIRADAARMANRFLSTLSLRRATVLFSPITDGDFISIHALLAESDGKKQFASSLAQQFLSTLSLRRATMTNSSL